MIEGNVTYSNSLASISIIIPAYNCEKTILSCLCSIENDYDMSFPLEVCVVTNGCTDNTKAVLEEKAHLFSFETKILRSDKGVSKARNIGLKNSTGNYIIFIDSDDLWAAGSFPIIVNNIKKQNADLQVYGFLKGVHQNTQFVKIVPDMFLKESIECGAKDYTNVLNWMLGNPTKRMQAWAKVYKRSAIKKIYFDENLKYSEDSEFVIRCLKAIKSIYIDENPIYMYLVNESSVMHSIDDIRIQQYVESLSKSRDEIKDMNEDIQKSFVKYALIHLNIILVHDVYNKESVFDTKILKNIISNDIFKKSLQNIRLRDCLSVQLLPTALIKLKLYLPLGMICKLRAKKNGY